jgi:hypothetical protein
LLAVGNRAVSERSLALRPRLATGLPLSDLIVAGRIGKVPGFLSRPHGLAKMSTLSRRYGCPPLPTAASTLAGDAVDGRVGPSGRFTQMPDERPMHLGPAVTGRSSHRTRAPYTLRPLRGPSGLTPTQRNVTPTGPAGSHAGHVRPSPVGAVPCSPTR